MAEPHRIRRKAAQPLAELVDACLGETLAKQGFAGADILVNWPDIVGEALARRSHPLRIAWPRKPSGAGRSPAPAEPATLHVRVEGAFALDLQHQAPLIIERVNAYFGWACIGRLRLEQGPVGRARMGRPERVAPPPEAVARAKDAVADVADQELRDALVRLGAAVIAEESGAKS